MIFSTIAFDADDTLWENEGYYTQAKQQYARLLAAYASPEWVEQELEKVEVGNVGVYGYGIKSFTLSMIETAIGLSGGRITADEIGKIAGLGREMLSAQVRPFAGAEATLEQLSREYPLMLVTKGDTLEQGQKVKRSGLAHYFRHVEIMGEKTSEAYRAMLKRHHLEPQRVLMVGNSLRSDILPVLEIGGQAVYIPYLNTWSHELAVEGDIPRDSYHELERLDQLPALLEKLKAEGD